MSANGLILLACATVVCATQAFLVYLSERNRRAAKVWARSAAKHAEDAREAARRAAEYLTKGGETYAVTQKLSWAVEKMGNTVHNDAEACLALRKDCQTAARAAQCAAASVLPDAEVSRDGS